MKHMIREDDQVKIKIYNKCKYEPDSVKVAEHTYEAGRVSSFEVISRSNEETFRLGFDDVDPKGIYLILVVDGEAATFRNSLCDMFIY